MCAFFNPNELHNVILILGTGMWNKALIHHDKKSTVQVVSVEEDQIKLGLWHFCKQTASAKSPKKLEVLVFQNPSSLENKTDAYITVYAVPKCSKKVKVKIQNIIHKFRA